MKESEKFLGKKFIHPELGLVTVESIKSRVMVNIVCIDKGNWCDLQKRNVPIMTVRPNINEYGKIIGKTIFYVGINPTTQDGHEDFCHINKLTPIVTE